MRRRLQITTLALLISAPLYAQEGIGVTRCQIQQGDVSETFESFGRLTSARMPTLSSEVDGRLQQVAVDTGEQVAAGALLAQIDPRDLQLERDAQAAEITRLKAQLTNEQRRVKRFNDLQKSDYLAQTQLEDAQAQIAVLQAQLQAADARLSMAADKLKRSTIRAPYAGQIEARLVAEGDFVSRGTPLFQLVDNHHLRAELSVPETLAHRLTLGQPVNISSPLVPDLNLSSRISAILPLVGGTNRALTLVVEFENPGPLRAGATAIGTITLATREAVLLVPPQAVVRRPAGETLYRIVDGKAEAVVVKVGSRQQGLVEVEGDLSLDQPIVCDGAGFLTDGVAVRPQGDE